MPAESAPVSEAGPGPDLVARIIQRDPSAEEELVHRYSRGVSFILSGSIANPSAVEDLRQETFRIALEKIRNGDVREPVAAGSALDDVGDVRVLGGRAGDGRGAGAPCPSRREPLTAVAPV